MIKKLCLVLLADKKHGIILQKQIKEGKTIQVELP